MRILNSQEGTLILELQSLEDTSALGEAMANALCPSMAVLLEGDLGAGKTTLIRAVCDGLGWKGAKSPSFSLVNEYEAAAIPAAHADLYRLEKADPRDLGFEDYLADGWILFVEWPDRLSRRDFENLWSCSVKAEESRRTVTLNASGPLALKALSALEERLR